ncbi:MAG: hypothetical protein ACREBG_27540 [Pyrinomonadaceae bacterium]
MFALLRSPGVSWPGQPELPKLRRIRGFSWSGWSDLKTRHELTFPLWAAALRDAGHEVRIELAGDATVLMHTAVSNSVTPVGWPPFSQALARVVELKIPIFV